MNTQHPYRSQWLRLALHVGTVVLLVGVSLSAHADTRIMDNIAQDYRNASIGWSGTLLGFANRLFALLALIELAWSAAVWVMDKNEFQSFFTAVAKKIMWIGIFYALLLNGPVWIPAIIDSFVDAGAAAGGGSGLSPTDVFNTGIMNAATLVSGMSALDILKDPAMVMFGGLSAIIIVLAFTVIAGQLLIALVESYIAISAGILFLGFGGSRWTTDFVQKFIGYAVATGVKLFMLYLIISIGNTAAVTWAPMLTNALGAASGEKFNAILTVMGGSVLLAFMAMQIPAMAASMLAGSPTLTAGGAAATGAAIGAGMIGAGAALASTTVGAAKAAGGMASAAKAAWGEAGAGGSSGLNRAVSTLGNMGSAAGSAMRSSAASSIAPTFGGRMADISTARTAEMSAANSPATPPAPPAPAQPAAPAAESAAPAGGSASASSTAGESVAAPASTGGSAAATVAAPTGTGSTESAPVAPNPTATANAAPTAPSGGSVTPPAPASPASLASATPAGGDFASMLEPKGTSQGSTVAAPASTGQAASTTSAISPTATSVGSNSIGGSTASSATSGAPSAQGPGLQDRLNEMRRVRPPQIPSDGASPATVSIRFDAPQD
jgi:type IV secretion system protein TrbL